MIDYKCPKCNATDEETIFRVVATALFDVSSWGTEDYENVEWTNDSPMWCGLCKHGGTVKDFTPTEEATADYVRAQGGTPCPRCGAFADPNTLCHSCTADDTEEATA